MYQIRITPNRSKVSQILPRTLFYSERAMLFNIQALQRTRLYKSVVPVTVNTFNNQNANP